MNIPASLIIKHNGEKVAANICVGGRPLCDAIVADDLQAAVDQALLYPYAKLHIKNALVAVDITKKKLGAATLSNILYVQILPAPTSHVDSHAFHNNDNSITDKALSFTVLYDFDDGFLNTYALFDMIFRTGVNIVAINSPFSVTDTPIEDMLCDLIAEKCPNVRIHSSRYLMSRDFMARGNLLMFNLMLRPFVAQYIADLSQSLRKHHSSGPIYFLRNNGGMIGQDTILNRGMDTYQCEKLSFLHDVAALHTNAHMYIADWDTQSLFITHHYRPQMIKSPIVYQNTKITRDIPVSYSLRDINTPALLRDLLNAHNPLPGPIPLIMIGQVPMTLSPVFEYPILRMKSGTALNQCGLSALDYILEVEAYENSLQNSKEDKKALKQLLGNQALKDNIVAKDADYMFESLPVKYLNDDQYILRASLRTNLGEHHEADD